MASKRKLAMRAKRLARKQSQTKPSGASKYGLKRARMHAGWDNPRSPFRYSEPAAPTPTVAPGIYDADDLATEILRAAEAPV